MRVLCFLFVLFLPAIWFHPVLMVAVCLLYIAIFPAYELLLVGMAIDAFFAPPGSVPYATLAIASALLLAEYIKPRVQWSR